MKIDIIGGGVAGCASALELSKKVPGCEIRIWENRTTLIAGTSHATPCRLTLGYHYFDQETAFKCLKTTIDFVRTYPGFKIIDLKKEKEYEYLKRGWYFVAKNSFHRPEKVLAFYKLIQAEYLRLVEDDPQNEVFGPPGQFIRVLEQKEYEHQVNPHTVFLGIETAECTLDFPRFRDFFIQELSESKQITVCLNQEVLEIRQACDHPGFSLLIKKNHYDAVHTVETDFVINASWENIESLNQKASFRMEPDTRTMRTKCMVQVKLPRVLEKAHSTFVCFGPFCSFTNLGIDVNGESTGFITSELATNIEQTTDLKLSERSKRFIHDGATLQEKTSYSTAIIQGVTEYIPLMKEAQALNVRFGIVKSIGKVDICSAISPSNERQESGVGIQQIGWISNASVKLLSCLENARSISTLVQEHQKILENIHQSALANGAGFPQSGQKTIIHFFNKHLQRYPDSSFGNHVEDPKAMLSFNTKLSMVVAAKKSCLEDLKFQFLKRNLF